MDISKQNHWMIVVFVGLGLYNMGVMLTNQLQHFSLYGLIDPASFQNYIRANNKAAILPGIIPGVLGLAFSISMIWLKPDSVSNRFIYIAVALNAIVAISTFLWQGRLHNELAATGFDVDKIQILATTNWIRTIAYCIQGFMCLWLINKLITRNT